MSGMVEPTDEEIALSVLNEMKHDALLPEEVSNAARLVHSYLEDKTR